jgi:hypothetical protein
MERSQGHDVTLAALARPKEKDSLLRASKRFGLFLIWLERTTSPIDESFGGEDNRVERMTKKPKRITS